MKHPLPIGPAVPGKTEAGPPRGSDASQCSDRSRVPSSDELSCTPEVKALIAAVRAETIEDCARIAERFAHRASLTTYATARDIARDIRGLGAPARVRRMDQIDFPSWAFV